MSSQDVHPGSTETQLLRVSAPPGVSNLSSINLHDLDPEQCTPTVTNILHAGRAGYPRPGRFFWISNRIDWVNMHCTDRYSLFQFEHIYG